MQTAVKCLLLAVCVAATLAVPAPLSGPRERRYAYPARTMMFSGYFRGQYPQQHGFRHYVPRNYEPEGAMTAFAAGNTVSAGSFYGNGNQAPADCSQCNGVAPSGEEDPNGPPPEVIPTTNDAQPPYDAPAYPEGGNGEGAPEDIPATEAPVEPSNIPEEIPEETAAPIPPPTNGNGYNGNGNGNGNGHSNGNGNGNGHRNGNGNGNGNGRGNGGRAPSRPRSDEEDPEEEDDSLPGSYIPGKKSRGRGNSYNTYFPMFFGSRSGGGSGSGEPFPGAATAIANSFSTGRGAVATSHATAYGGPHYLSGNGSRKGNSRRPSNSS